MTQPFADDLRQALRSSGWLPNESCLADPFEPGQNLLPILRESANRCLKQARAAVAGRRERLLAQLLDWLSERGSELTFGWPGIEWNAQRRWIGARLMWWPSGVASGRKVAWVSSRLGRAIDERPDWFAVLRAAATKLDADRDLLLTAATTTTDRFLERAAILFGLRLLRIELNERPTLADWLLRLRRRLQREYLLARSGVAASDDSFCKAESTASRSDSTKLSPPLSRHETDADLAAWPIADRLLLLVANQAVVLQVRARGNLHSLLKRRLSESVHKPGSVWLAWGNQLVPPDIVEELQSAGAVSWHLQPSETPPDATSSEPPRDLASSSTDDAMAQTNSILSHWPWGEGDYLLHWTRRRHGAWPDQPGSDFVDELLMNPDARDASAFASLLRIILQRRLVASSANIRGGHRVVSFSALPIGDLRGRRFFRAHRTHFDFEPFGLGVRRNWLIERGARPVQYGDDSLWPTLSEAERPFFQLRQTRGRNGATVIDWSIEAEWRTVGDIELPPVGSPDIAFFVPTFADAKSLAAVSPWPIFVVGVGASAGS